MLAVSFSCHSRFRPSFVIEISDPDAQFTETPECEANRPKRSNIAWANICCRKWLAGSAISLYFAEGESGSECHVLKSASVRIDCPPPAGLVVLLLYCDTAQDNRFCGHYCGDLTSDIVSRYAPRPVLSGTRVNGANTYG
jgi:hypothetical protein